MSPLTKLALILAVLLLPLSSMAIEPDKEKHRDVSMFLGAAFYTIYRKHNTKSESYLYAVLSVMALGGAKELILDDKPDIEDMEYNLIGATLGPLIPLVIINF